MTEDRQRTLPIIRGRSLIIAPMSPLRIIQPGCATNIKSIKPVSRPAR